MSVSIFSAQDGANGQEIWLTNGTPEGTFLLLDIYPGTPGSSVSFVAEVGGKILFSAYDPVYGQGTWVTDGTPAGTVRISDVSLNSSADEWQMLDGVLLAYGYDPVYGSGLIRTDGTEAGTTYLANTGYFSYPTQIGDSLIFRGYNSTTGQELWITDGTTAGTHLLADINPGISWSNIPWIHSLGDRAVFLAYEDSVSEYRLWATDGTGPGTVLLADVNPAGPDDISDITTIGTKAVFLAYSDISGSSDALWVTDGTVAGTFELLDTGYAPAQMTVVGNRLFFQMFDGTETRLFVTDGTLAGTATLTGPGIGLSGYGIFVAGNRVLTAAYDNGLGQYVLISSDGTTGGTTAIPDVYLWDGRTVGGLLIFQGSGVEGSGIFVTDGTEAGTEFLAGGLSVDWNNSVVSGGRLFFVAYDASGYELWSSDGTAAGTALMADITPGSSSSSPANLMAYAGGVLFSATDPATGTELYFSDGTAAGTGLVRDINTSVHHSASLYPERIVDVGGRAFFLGNTPTAGTELWVSDGTGAGTSIVQDSTLGPENSNSPDEMVAVGSLLFFNRWNGSQTSLWVSDGTDAGTTALTGAGFGVNDLGVIAGRLVFEGYDNSTGYGLWTSDGTVAGTVEIFAGLDVYASAATGMYAELGSYLYFYGYDSNSGNSGLWRTDGTAAGTSFVAAADYIDTTSFKVAGSHLFFQGGASGTGYELWVSDGTPAGTGLAADIFLGGNSSGPERLEAIGNKVTFTAVTPTHGQELWVSDGTLAGTIRLADITPGPDDTGFIWSGASATHSFYSAYDAAAGGYRVWATDGTVAGTGMVSADYTVYNGTYLEIVNGVLIMDVYDDTLGQWGLVAEDGNPATAPVWLVTGMDFYGARVVQDGVLYYHSHDPSTGESVLARTDGTVAGTYAVAPISDFANAASAGGLLYFRNYDSVNGYELWVSDGTAAGTQRLTDTVSADHSYPGNFVILPNVAPTITGTQAGQAVADKVNIQPFTATTIGDLDRPNQTLTVTVTLDNPAKGGLTASSLNATGFVNLGGGVYSFTGTAAAATAAIRGLAYNPADNRVPAGQTETTTFAIAVNDGAGGTATDSTTTVVSTSINDAPTNIVVAGGGTLTIAENSSNSTVVGSVIGVDPDSPSLGYALVGNAGGRFSINGATGAIRVADGLLLDREQAASHTITVRVSDGTYFIDRNFTITVSDVAPELVNGDGRDNVIMSGAGGDTLYGGAGNDTLNAGAGADTMYGGIGNDRFYVDNAGDVVVENAGEGTDSIYSTVSYSLAGAHVESLILVEGTGNTNATGNSLANLLYGNSGNNQLNGLTGADTMTGGLGDDTYYVDNAGDTVVELAGGGTDRVVSAISHVLAANVEHLTLSGTAPINGTGNALANELTGNTAANVLDGGAGADTMSGGQGDDTYHVDNAGDVVVESYGQGIDTVISSITFSLAGINAENVTLTGAADLGASGNSLANVLTGNSGNNVLNGFGGADTMTGGLGNDRYYVESAGDVVIENANEGTDSIYSSVSYSLTGTHVEYLVLTGSGNLNGSGNSLANRLYGNSGNNVLNGSTGADTMIGGLGNDTYHVDNAGDVVLEEAGAGTSDTVISALTYTLTDNVENLTLSGADSISGTGNALMNQLIGNNGNNVLNGGAGADTMTGGGGNDRYYVDNLGDVVVENANEGTDSVYSSVSFGLLGTHVENLVLTGSGNLNGTGNSLANLIVGNSGNNVLNGSTGADTLTGGGGTDAFVFNTALGPANVDAITDMTAGVDQIRLAAGVFTTLPGGVLAAGAFHIGAAAADAADRIIYDSTTGNLFYDADGSGVGAAVQFARLGTGLALAAGDFFVF